MNNKIIKNSTGELLTDNGSVLICISNKTAEEICITIFYQIAI
jgi:hypothetical protein